MVGTWHNIFPTRLFSPITVLTTLLIHVVNVLLWHVGFSNNYKKEVKVVPNDWVIKCLATLWVQARWLSKLDLGPMLEEPVNPIDTWLLAAKSLSPFLNTLLIERMCCVREKDDPVNENPLCLWGEELFPNRYLAKRYRVSQRLVMEGMIGDIHIIAGFKLLANICILGFFLTSKNFAAFLYDLFNIMKHWQPSF
jgi:hypothetical protein